MSLYTDTGYTGGGGVGLYAQLLLCLEFFTSVLCTQERGTEYYYLTANKTRDVFHNSGSLASLKLENTWGGALISVYLFKITLLFIFLLYFYNGFIFGVGEVVYIRNHFCVSILIGLKLRVWIYDERQTDYPSKSFFISSNREREYYTDTLILFLCLAEKKSETWIGKLFFLWIDTLSNIFIRRWCDENNKKWSEVK